MKRERELELRKRKAKKNRLVIMLAAIVVVIGVSICFAMLGVVDKGGDVQNNIPIKAEWITAQVAGDIVSIPVSEVESNKIVHFRLSTPGGDMVFMAYKVAGKLYVRSNICPPCSSVGFSLQGDILVCDTCKTTFNAKTGDGIEGACIDFPKASVPYEISDGIIVMKSNDLVAAHQSTLNPGWP